MLILVLRIFGCMSVIIIQATDKKMLRVTQHLTRRLFTVFPRPVTPQQSLSTSTIPVQPLSQSLPQIEPFAHNLPTSVLDPSNLTNFLSCPSTPKMSLWEKISQLSPGNMYTAVDELSRQLLFGVANDYQLGLPMAVVVISCALRLSFFYPNIRGQIGALKMKEIKPHMDRFQEKVRIAQMTKNMAMMKVAREELRAIQKEKGIDNFYAFVNLVQIPFLITWFISLRYVAALPEVYPTVTQSFAWISDISSYDPYFILPVVSALLSSYSISISPGLRNANVLPIMQPFIKYLKYLPFLSLPITGFFPAIINLYWCTLSVNQALLMMAMNSKFLINYLDTSTKKNTHSQIQKAVFVEEKPKSVQSGTSAAANEPVVKVGSSDVKVETLKILSKKPKKVPKEDK